MKTLKLTICARKAMAFCNLYFLSLTMQFLYINKNNFMLTCLKIHWKDNKIKKKKPKSSKIFKK